MGDISSRRAALAYTAAACLTATLTACGATTAPDPNHPVPPTPPSTPATASPPAAPTVPTVPRSPDVASPTPSPTSGPPAAIQQPGPDVSVGGSGRPEIALTFHGQGDPTIARGVLSACAAAGAQITVFAVGQWVDQYPTLMREIVAAGHDLGNHTWSHPDLPSLSLAAATTEIRKCAESLAKAVGSPGWYFRPSSAVTSTATIRQAAQAAGYARCIAYSVDPEDFREPGPALVRARTKAGAAPGAIVSLHLGHRGTLEALPGILADLRAAGLTAVTMTTLLST